jgi:hypothetical protein
MSDTVQAPPSTPAPSAPPPALPSEAPIGQASSAPAPITNTPPEKPVAAKEGKGSHRYDVVSKAFERAKVERKGPAEAKAGHNQPPEPVEKEEPLDLKKRPSEQPAAQARERGEGGRFVPKAGADQAGTAPAQTPAAGQQGSVTGPTAVPYGQPLKRMRDDAKAEWTKAPESVRRDVYRMHQEYSKAFQQYRGDHEAMKTLRPYHDLARSQGTSLPVALDNYMGIESRLRQDPIGGLDTIVSNLNLRTEDGRRITLVDVAYHVLNQSPEQHKLTAAQNQQVALQRQLQQVQQHQRALAQQQARMQYQQKFVHTRGAVDRFAEANPRLDELGDLIERELRLGFDLPTAYQRANLLRPAKAGTPAAQTRTPAPQTRTSDRSISGAPDGGSANGVARKRSTDRRGSVVNAMRRANGAL